MEGYITLNREFLNWEWFDNSKMVKIFIYFLLRANTEEKDWHCMTIHRGQLATDLSTIATGTGLSKAEIITCLRLLAKSGYITYDSIYKFSQRYMIITICNSDAWVSIGNEE